MSLIQNKPIMTNDILSQLKEYVRRMRKLSRTSIRKGGKVFALIFGIIFLLFLSCSCSSSRPVVTEKAVSDSETIFHKARDSISSDLSLQSASSGYLDISDLQILFYPPALTPHDSLPDLTANPHPAAINIGHISAGKKNDTKLHETKDSVVSDRLDTARRSESHNESIQNSRSRDPTSCRWPVLLVLGFALVMIVFTGYRLYRSENH